jgi:beta-N-acetylglucosaminidase
MKRFLGFIVAFALILSIFTPNTASAADDITGHYFEKDMRSLIAKDILGGYGDGKYLPDRSVTRAEFASFVIRSLDLQTMSSAEVSIAQVSDSQVFHDVSPKDWYYSAVIAASNNGIVGGYPGNYFKPNKKISRQEMAAMIMRAINSKGIVSEKEPLNFEDNKEINPMFHDPVQRLLYLNIMSGKKDGEGNVYFAPTSDTTRGETAAVINRMLRIVFPPQNLDYQVATLSANGDPIVVKEFETFEEAKNAAKDNQVVMHGKNIAWIKSGLAVSNKFTTIYTSTSYSANATYVASGVEMKYFDAGEEWVKVQVADTVGYVDPETVNLTPLSTVESRSHYKVSGNDLIHVIYNPITKGSTSYTVGKAPNFLSTGQKYYSWNGNDFYTTSGTHVGNAYQYFNRLPLYTKTTYTAEQLDAYLKDNHPNSPLIGTGDAFKKAEAQYGTNALYFLAHAALESNWGKSRIAVDKNNLFGYGAVDSSPYESALKFESYEKGILTVADKFIVNGYFNESDWRFEGEHLGNKGTGMNVRYASDPYWGQKISGIMYEIDQYLSEKYNQTPEVNKYQLAETVTTSVNVRSKSNTDGSILYQIPDKGTTVQVLDTVSATGTWYNIAPKNVNGKDYSDAFTYSDGYSAYGTSFKLLPLAK